MLKCTFGPRTAVGALFTREESPINSWSEMLTDEVGEIIAKDRAEGGECHEHRDSRVHTAGCCYTESNDRGPLGRTGMTASRPGTTSAMTYEIGESTWSIEMSIMDADPRWLAWCLEVGAQEEGRPRSKAKFRTT